LSLPTRLTKSRLAWQRKYTCAEGWFGGLRRLRLLCEQRFDKLDVVFLAFIYFALIVEGFR
jgi:hypothetical protein